MILDELLRLAPHARVVTIDTGVLFPETLRDLEAPSRTASASTSRSRTPRDPADPWTGPEHCCAPAKVAALERALDGADAWITGIRREQADTRADAELVERDEQARHRGSTTRWPSGPRRTSGSGSSSASLPYHPLHDQGYASIGCAPCTQPGDGREGRWAGTDKTECGLHVARGLPRWTRSSSPSASASASSSG